MTTGRCQLCSRRTRLNAAGLVAHHHVKGAPCRGVGALPIEQDDARLIAVQAELEQLEREKLRELAALFDRRANYIEPALLEALADAGSAARKLERRIRRLHGWPARYAREMARQGWSDPPPAYLVARQAEIALVNGTQFR